MKRINKKNKFILIQLPICILLILLILEILAYLLSDYRAIRHSLDRKVNYIENYNINVRNDILLFGDSITKDIADDYNIYRKKYNIANMTTNRASGLVGVFLLYKKYIEKNKPPKYLVVSCTPRFITFFPEYKIKKLYLTSVFNSKDEINFITSYYDRKEYSFYQNLKHKIKALDLSILNIENNIIYPLVNSLGFINTFDSLSIGKKSITEVKRSDLNPIKNHNKLKDKKYKNSSIIITPYNEKLIEDFFKRLKYDEVKLFISWAPIQEDYFYYLSSNNQLNKLENMLKKKATEINLDISFHNFSYPKPFPKQAFRDEDHLKLGYWRNYYAFLLRNYIENKVF
ncbi:hypothetical protein N9V56_01380 [Alphaproteobacteria bacterium]|nr:hypothetical protein [Alphaproteobacteria bacterium]